MHYYRHQGVRGNHKNHGKTRKPQDDIFENHPLPKVPPWGPFSAPKVWVLDIWCPSGEHAQKLRSGTRNVAKRACQHRSAHPARKAMTSMIPGLLEMAGRQKLWLIVSLLFGSLCCINGFSNGPMLIPLKNFWMSNDIVDC